MKATPPLEELLEFPTSFTFRVVATERPDLEEDVVERVGRILDRPNLQVGRQASSRGSFTSIRVTAVVTTADEIRSVYASLQGVQGLHMLL